MVYTANLGGRKKHDVGGLSDKHVPRALIPHRSAQDTSFASPLIIQVLASGVLLAYVRDFLKISSRFNEQKKAPGS